MSSPPPFFRVLAAIFAAALLAGPASPDTVSPFVPAPPPKPKIVRLLAGVGLFDPHVLAEFEAAGGGAVAYDAYESPDAVAERWRDGPYDLVALPGPVLARRISALARLDKSKLPSARAVQPLVAAKL